MKNNMKNQFVKSEYKYRKSTATFLSTRPTNYITAIWANNVKCMSTARPL